MSQAAEAEIVQAQQAAAGNGLALMGRRCGREIGPDRRGNALASAARTV